MADIKDDQEYPPLGEEILAQIRQMAEEAEGGLKEELQELLREKTGTSQKPAGPVQPVLTSQFFILLTFLLLITSMCGKRFVLDLNITSSIHYSDFCFL